MQIPIQNLRKQNELVDRASVHEIKTFIITFPGNRQALAFRVGVDCDPVELASALKLPQADGVMLLVGGAGFASPEVLERMSAFFDALAD